MFLFTKRGILPPCYFIRHNPHRECNDSRWGLLGLGYGAREEDTESRGDNLHVEGHFAFDSVGSVLLDAESLDAVSSLTGTQVTGPGEGITCTWLNQGWVTGTVGEQCVLAIDEVEACGLTFLG